MHHGTNSHYLSIQYYLTGFYNRDLTLCSPVVTICTASLTFKIRASHIEDRHTATLQMLHYIYIYIYFFFFQQISVLSILNMLHTLSFSLQNAVYFIMLPFFWFLYYSHFTYRVC
jgi:hypothetical protein